MNQLKQFYERNSDRFWDPSLGMGGRDNIIYPLLNDLGGTLLEYGCGAGSLLLALVNEDRFTKAYGIDISESALLALRKANHEREALSRKLVLSQPNDDLLPFIDTESIDVLISVATIEHVLNPYVVLDELFRVAKQDSTLICSVPNYAYIKHRLALLLGNQPKTGTDEPVEKWRNAGWDGMHLHTFTKKSFSILLADCGWRPVCWTGWGERIKWLGHWRRRYPGLLSGEIIAVCRKG